MAAVLLAALVAQVVRTGAETEEDLGPRAPFTGLDYVDLETLARRYQVVWSSDAATGREVLRSPKLTVVFAPSLDTALVDGVPRRLAKAVAVSGGRVQVPVEIARLIDSAAAVRRTEPVKVQPKIEPRKKQWFTVVLDPGHGGLHTGCKGRSGVFEKELTLDLALRLKPLLEEAGARVLLTRTDDRHFDEDVHRDLQHRVNVVNRERPDVFLSIHVNYVPHSEPRGFELWVRRNDRGSRELASYLRGEMNRALPTEDRGIKDEKALYVLRHTSCPAVLVEVGFISNPTEERYLLDAAYRQKIAGVLAEAVRKYVTARR